MNRLEQVYKTTLVSSFAASVWRNQFTTTKKYDLLHSTVKAAISDVSISFWMDLWSGLTIDKSGQKSLILQRQLRGYKSLDPPTPNIRNKYCPISCCTYKINNTPIWAHPLVKSSQAPSSSECGHTSTQQLPKGKRNKRASSGRVATDSIENAAKSHTTAFAYN